MIWDVPFLFSVWGGGGGVQVNIWVINVSWALYCSTLASMRRRLTTSSIYYKLHRRLKKQLKLETFLFSCCFSVRLPFYATSSFWFLFKFLLPFLPSFVVFPLLNLTLVHDTPPPAEVMVKYKIVSVLIRRDARFHCFTEWWHTGWWE